MIKYLIEYMEIAKKAVSNGFSSERIRYLQKINFYKKEINDYIGGYKNIKTAKFIQTVYKEVSGIPKANDRAQVYLEHLGIHQKFYEVLYNKKEELEPYCSITLLIELSDNSTKEEEFASYGCNSEDELINRYNKFHEGCDVLVVGSWDFKKIHRTRYHYDVMYTIITEER